jgi:hypothetical protein
MDLSWHQWLFAAAALYVVLWLAWETAAWVTRNTRR